VLVTGVLVTSVLVTGVLVKRAEITGVGQMANAVFLNERRRVSEREAAECEAVAAIRREAEEREAAEWQRWAKRQAVTV